MFLKINGPGHCFIALLCITEMLMCRGIKELILEC